MYSDGGDDRRYGLFCGSPIGNASVLSYMNSALGADYSPTFAEWAAVSMPTMLLCIVPMIMVYVRWFKLDRKAVISSDRSYYDEQLRALGRMSGAEWRWLIILVCMIVTMFLGVSTAYAAIFFAALSMFPCIGVSDCREVFKRLPWNSLIAICMLPLMSTVIVDNGISDWLGTLLRPLLVDFSPLAFSLVCSVTLAVHINVMVNSMQAAMALVMSIAAPICVSSLQPNHCAAADCVCKLLYVVLWRKSVCDDEQRVRLVEIQRPHNTRIYFNSDTGCSCSSYSLLSRPHYRAATVSLNSTF